MKKALSLLLAMLLVSALVSLFVVPVSADAASGICAVGQVDGTKAAIILSNGAVKTVDHDGSAVSGKVCTYAVSGNVYTFTEVIFTGYYGWRIYDGAPNDGDKTDLFYGTDGTNHFYVHFDANAVCFVKQADTKWEVKNGGEFLSIPKGTGDTNWDNTAYPANIDAVDVDGNGTMDILIADVPAAVANNYGGVDGLKLDQIFSAGNAVDVVIGNEADAPETADGLLAAAVVAVAAIAVVPFAKKKHN